MGVYYYVCKGRDWTSASEEERGLATFLLAGVFDKYEDIIEQQVNKIKIDDVFWRGPFVEGRSDKTPRTAYMYCGSALLEERIHILTVKEANDEKLPKDELIKQKLIIRNHQPET